MPHLTRRHSHGGYIALMATVIISLLLLVMVAREGFAGWYARFTILGIEAKEQASALAEGCADQALVSLITDPTFVGGATSTTEGGVCHIFPIGFDQPAEGLVTIRTQAEVRGSYANLELTMDMNSVHVGAVPSNPIYGTLVVYTHVINDNGGGNEADDFTVSVPTAVQPAQQSFSGTEGGMAVTVAPGAYSAGQISVAGYQTDTSPGCAGTIAAGEIKACVITNNDVSTTLTVIANIVNDDSGTTTLSQIPLSIDGVVRTAGMPYTLSAGAHMASAPAIAGYTASTWGYECSSSGSVTLNVGDNKTCIITYNDDPPPSPICADTIMMLDRTGSMFWDTSNSFNWVARPQWMADEKNAAKGLISLFGQLSPHPKIGIGRLSDDSRVSADIFAPLSADYTNLVPLIDGTLLYNGQQALRDLTTFLFGHVPLQYARTNLFDAISVADAELNGPNHSLGKKKVVILLSDGVANLPSGSDDVDVTLAPSGIGVQDSWAANVGTKKDAVAGNDSDTTYVTASIPAQTFGLQNSTLPAGASNISVSLHMVGKAGVGSAALQLVAENGSSFVSQGSNISLGSSYATSTWVMNTNPITGGGWQASDIANWGTLKFGVLNTSTGSAVPRLTQLYASVGYNTSTAATPRLPLTAGSSSSDDWSNPTRALTNDGQYATETSDGDRHRFSNFGFSVPANATIAGIQVDVEAKSTDPSGCEIDVDISSNNSNFGNDKTIGLTSTDTLRSVGGVTDTWGDSWTPAEVNSSNFAVRITYVDPGSSCSGTASVDYLQARIFYTQPAPAVVLPVASAGNYSAWTPNTGTPLAAALVQDGDTAYLSTAAGAVQSQSFSFPNMSVPAGASGITVSLSAVAKETGGTSGSIQFFAERSGTIQTGSTHSLSGSYNTYTWPVNNPFGGSWSIAELNNWSTRFGFNNTSSGGTLPRVTRVYLTVSYTINTDPSSAALAAAAAAKLPSGSGKASDNIGTNIYAIHFGNASGVGLLRQVASHSTLATSTILSGSRSGGLVTLTTTAAHQLAVNQEIVVSGAGALSGTFMITSTTTNSITYAQSGGNASVGSGGSIAPTNLYIAPTSGSILSIFRAIGAQECPAVNNPPAPAAPTKGTVTILTNVVNNNSGNATASGFTGAISGSSPSQTSYSGSATGVVVTINPGAYHITEDPKSGYTQLIGANCSGTIAAGEFRICSITNDDIPPPPPPPDLNIDTTSWQENP